MATATWVGVAPGTFITNTNWNPANVPIDADVLTCNRNNSISIAGANHAGIRLASLKTQRGYVGNIGSVATPLTIDVVDMVHQGLGTLYLTSDDNASTEFTTRVVIDTPTGAAFLDGEKMEFIDCLNGKTTLQPTLGTVAVPTRVIVGSDTNPMGNPILVISDNGTTPGTTMVTEVNQFSGRVDCAGVVDVVSLMGGRWYQSDEEIARLMVYRGGQCFYGAEQTNGTLTEAYVYAGGVLDTTYLGRGVTITDLYLFKGGIVKRDPALLTITNEHNYGGHIIDAMAGIDVGQVVAIGGGAGVA